MASSQSLPTPGVLLVRLGASLVVIGAITAIFTRWIPVNETTAGFLYLVAILGIATSWGFVEAAVASICAMLCFNYFFLPPIGTFTIADPQNWIALFAFLITSLVSSRLSDRAKQRAHEAIERQTEMEKLYALSRGILLSDDSRSIGGQITQQIAQVFNIRAVALYDNYTKTVFRAGPEEIASVDEHLHDVASRGHLLRDEKDQTVVTAIRLGGEPTGSLAIKDHSLSDTALQSLANLVAIGIEKNRAQDAANRAEAAKRSEELKSMLLDAIAHEFKTPLTSIKAAATACLSTEDLPEHQRELTTVIDEEADRLSMLVEGAVDMARVEAGNIQVQKRYCMVKDLIDAALHQMQSILRDRIVEVKIDQNIPLAWVDADLIKLSIRQLLDNAVKYSNPATAISILASHNGTAGIRLSVVDQGFGISADEHARIFDRFYRSSNTRNSVTGTGMGLAIVQEIMRAHEGAVEVKSKPGAGSEFSLLIPEAERAEGV